MSKRAVLLFSDEEQKKSISLEETNVFLVTHIKDAVHHIVDNPEIVSIIYQFNNDETVKIIELSKKIKLLNPLITHLVDVSSYLDSSKKKLRELSPSLFLFETYEQLLAGVHHEIRNQRKFNRTHWPVKVKIFLDRDYREHEWGCITSLSASGCFVKFPNVQYVQNVKEIYLIIYFKDFNFMVDAEMIRIETENGLGKHKGFAVGFKNVTICTEQYIDSIIKDHLIQELFKDL